MFAASSSTSTSSASDSRRSESVLEELRRLGWTWTVDKDKVSNFKHPDVQCTHKGETVFQDVPVIHSLDQGGGISTSSCSRHSKSKTACASSHLDVRLFPDADGRLIRRPLQDSDFPDGKWSRDASGRRNKKAARESKRTRGPEVEKADRKRVKLEASRGIAGKSHDSHEVTDPAEDGSTSRSAHARTIILPRLSDDRTRLGPSDDSFGKPASPSSMESSRLASDVDGDAPPSSTVHRRLSPAEIASSLPSSAISREVSATRERSVSSEKSSHHAPGRQEFVASLSIPDTSTETSAPHSITPIAAASSSASSMKRPDEDPAPASASGPPSPSPETPANDEPPPQASSSRLMAERSPATSRPSHSRAVSTSLNEGSTSDKGPATGSLPEAPGVSNHSTASADLNPENHGLSSEQIENNYPPEEDPYLELEWYRLKFPKLMRRLDWLSQEVVRLRRLQAENQS
ncbi:hypothetical protein BD324DRAFT_640019 [Kockovaella imperatae]|uniref:Uncharacterized protein n=1 Tax=Kockovaella imperatae TaxID=4999 RepID=A0A1Y1U5R4_9TREE|nr:hypothetical protein BD324DRAFT_640019 [Kockovaella imperatae]ORX33369.1 hypothetical protein BD324DRAFT_640019 [Kockovaella imperatae]